MGGARDQRAGSKTPDNWPENLDIDALLATGWRPTPFQEFVLKVHGRCDLACDYCYVYRSADQRWRTQPRIMSLTVAARAAARIAEHAERHRLTHVRVVLHGGEPLLRTPHDLAQIIELIRRATGDLAHVEMTVQTNGMRLHEPYLQLFKRNDVRVGVSLDGDATAHNRHRRTPNGGGSHDLVAAGIRRLISPSYRHLFGGLLCVIDPRTDATSVYKGLLEYDPPMVDFLLPHGHWSVPPPGRVQGDPATPYADWLIEIFELWYGGTRTTVTVRFLAGIVNLLLGGRAAAQGVGLAPHRTVIVETDGGIEQGDVLKTSRPGVKRSGRNVLRDPFDAALRERQVVAQQLGLAALAPLCRSCTLRWICGGGFYPHRYKEGAGFANPSVYCPDLYRLIHHIKARVGTDLARSSAVPA